MLEQSMEPTLKAFGIGALKVTFMTTSVGFGLGIRHKEIYLVKCHLETLLPAPYTRPVMANEAFPVLPSFSEVPGGVAPGQQCPITAPHAWPAHHSP